MTRNEMLIIRAALDTALLNAESEEASLKIYTTIQTINADLFASNHL